MDPQDRRAGWEAPTAALREQVDSLLVGLTRQTAALTTAQARAAEVTGRATSDDGLVTVTVNASGVVSVVEIAPTAFTRSTPEKLARGVSETARRAATEARKQVLAALAPVSIQDLPDLPDVLPGVRSLEDLLPTPAEPEAEQPGADNEEDFSNRSILRADH